MKRLLFISALMLSLWGCRSEIQVVPEKVTLKGVELALGVGAQAYTPTKGSPAVIKEMESQFSGITETIIVPFEKRGVVEATDRCLYYPCLPGAIGTLVDNNRSHLFNSASVSLPQGTASVLAYGVTPAHTNEYGALAEANIRNLGDLRYPSYVRFSPVPIYGDEIPDAGQQIADILSGIVAGASRDVVFYYYENGEWKSGHVSVAWDGNSDNVNMREWFTWITNDGRILTGCGFNVEYMITRLYRLFKSYSSSNFDRYEYAASTGTVQVVKTEGGDDYLTWADIYNALRDEVLDRIDNNANLTVTSSEGHYTVQFADPVLSGYPGNLGLPDGSAVIRWTGTGFQPVGESIDGAASISRFCYPPKLWYFANTTVRTSDEDMDQYYTAEKDTWGDIVSEYRDGIAVAGDTKSVALVNPLQYSAGMLVCTVRASSSTLDDGDGDLSTVFPATGNNFELTGVILGSQKELDFEFRPQPGGDQFFLYDHQVSGISLTTTESAPVKVLASETPEGDNVYFCLEFKNNCGKTFTGVSGEIVPGGTFYLVGSLDMPPAESGYKSVFIRDCATTATCTITTLANALNSIPDLENPRLTLGLQTGVNWIQSTSSYILLY